MDTLEHRHRAYLMGVRLAQRKHASWWLPTTREDRARNDAAELANLGTYAVPLVPLALAHTADAIERHYTPAEMQKGLERQLRQALEVAPDVTVNYRNMKPLDAYFNPASKQVFVSSKTSPSTLAHELGHASGSPVGKLYGPSKLLSFGVSIPISLMVQAHNDPDSTAATIAKFAPGVVASPMLYEEGRASIRALRALNRVGGMGAVARGLPGLLGAFGTYGAIAAAPFVGGKIIQHLLAKDERMHNAATRRT